MTPERVQEILTAHRAWLEGPSHGGRAELTKANLTEADLRDADLTKANLTEADLTNTKGSATWQRLKRSAENSVG